MHWCRWLIICLVLSALLEPVKAQESTRIALIKEGQDGDYPQLCVMLAEMTCVALDPYGMSGDLTWSPDGRYVAFSASGDLVFLDTRQMKVHWVTRGAQ